MICNVFFSFFFLVGKFDRDSFSELGETVDDE